jgi:tetratricopeptide (TPR) repeat protein
MVRAAFWLASLAPACAGHAQDPTQVPALRAALGRPLADTARAQVLVKLCFNLTPTDPDSAAHFGEQGLALAQRIKHDKSIADAHNNLGWLALAQGRTQEADSLFQMALQRFEGLKNPAFLSVVRSNMGWLAVRTGDRVGALKQFQAALALAETARDSGNIAVLLYNIGTTYNKMEEFGRARDHFVRSLAMERSLTSRPDKEGICLLGIANTYRSEGDTTKALANYAHAAELFARIGDRYHAGLVAENTAALFEKNDPGAAVGYYGKALAAYRDLDLPNDQAYVFLGLGNLHRSAGDLAKAGGALSEGVALAKRSGDMQLVMDYEYALAELADRMGDSKATGEHFKRFIALSDSLRNAGSENELMRLRAEFETEQAEKDNELLRLKDRENSERLRTRNIQLYGSLILAVLALGAVALAWRNIRLRKRHEVELEALNAELHGKQARIEEINGLLRLKVLRTQMDPHFIHNCLNAIRALSLKGAHERAEEYLEGFARLLRNVLEHSVRDRISLDEEIAFLNDYVRLEQLRLGSDFTWSITADEALLAEEPQVPSLLVQPFVENAIWHGLAPKQGPKGLEVRFSSENGEVSCRVEDNGVGRTKKEATPGRTSLGLKLTGERLELLTERMKSEGAFTVEDLRDATGEAAGTRVNLKLVTAVG